MMNEQIDNALPKMRTTALIISFVAFGVSVIYTILFNMGQAGDSQVINLFGHNIYYAKVLLAVTGALQDSTEILAFLFGFWVLTRNGKKPLFFIILAWASITLSITLVIWSIASTWGGNNAMIDQSTAASELEKKKLALIEQTIGTNSAVVADLKRNAQAIREQAGKYGNKYISRSIDKIHEANNISEQAAATAATSLHAIDKLNEVDNQLIAHVNSASAAFKRIGAAFGLEEKTVGNTFLLTRAAQLEMIGIITGLFVIMIPAASKSRNQSKTTPATPTGKPGNDYNIDPKQVGGLGLNTQPTVNAGKPMTGMGFNALTSTSEDKKAEQPEIPPGDLSWAAKEGMRRYAANPDKHIPGESLEAHADRITQKYNKPSTSERIKEAAIQGAEKAAANLAALNTAGNIETPAASKEAAALIDKAVDGAKEIIKTAKRPANIDPRWLKAAKLPEFPSVFTAIVTGECPPVQNQIAVKRKLCGNHKAVQIMELMWIYHWLDKVEKTGRFKLPEQHDRLKLALPTTEQQAQRHIKIIKALAEKDTETKEKAA